jgi:hypothetical protein
MRPRFAFTSLTALVLLLVAPTAALGQSPTPGVGGSGASETTAPGPGGAGSTGTPQVGSPVDFVSEGGLHLATITVDEVQPGYDEFSEFFDPDPDRDYVAVTYTFAGGDELIEVSTYNLTLETGGGFLWHAGFVGRPEDVEVLDLESSFNLSPGESETGIIVFDVPRDAELVRLWWQPELDRLVELANLRES